MHSTSARSVRSCRPRSASISVGLKPTAVAFAPAGRLLLIADMNGRVRFFDSVSLDEVASHDGSAGPTAALEASPDGRRLATIGTSGLRLLGGSLPAMVPKAGRQSRFTVQGGALAVLAPEIETSLLRQYSQPHKPPNHNFAAAQFFRLLCNSDSWGPGRSPGSSGSLADSPAVAFISYRHFESDRDRRWTVSVESSRIPCRIRSKVAGRSGSR